jgi:hypothetical protein
MPSCKSVTDTVLSLSRYVYKWAYLHRIKGIQELKTITAEIVELRGTIAKLKKNQDQFYAKVIDSLLLL